MSEVDAVNRLHITGRSAVRASFARGELDGAEIAALASVAESVRGKPILDLGVGGGRTVEALRSLSTDYLAVDYSAEMVAACRARFPDVAVQLGDARDLSALPRSHFALVMFSCNGLGMMGHADRLRVLAEVRGVVAPGGAFAFSTHNLASPANHRRFVLPPLALSANPVRSAVRLLRFARSTATRAINRGRYWRQQERHDDWAILNSDCLDYGTLLYNVTAAASVRQLVNAGFSPDVAMFDLAGNAVRDTPDDSIFYVARV